MQSLGKTATVLESMHCIVTVESIECVCVRDDVRTLPNVVHREIDRRWLERCAIDQLTETGMEDSLTSARLQQVNECNAKSELKFHVVAAREAIVSSLRSNHYRLSSFNLTVFG